MLVDLLKADDGAAGAKLAVPRPKGRFCGECKAFVTVLGRTEGLFCDRSACPFPKLNHGGPGHFPPAFCVTTVEKRDA